MPFAAQRPTGRDCCLRRLAEHLGQKLKLVQEKIDLETELVIVG